MENNSVHEALTIEEAEEALAQFIDDLPPEIFKGLNCGVAIKPDTTFDKNGLVILGQYHVDPRGLGRYVTIHYGSMVSVYGHLSPQKFKEKLKEVLHHELTHHLESLAGDRSLEIKDAHDVAKMLVSKRMGY